MPGPEVAAVAPEESPGDDFADVDPQVLVEDVPEQPGSEEGDPIEDNEPSFGAVVVPFPRRFAEVPAVEWDEAPSNAVEFTSSLFNQPPQPAIGSLTEPGGSIPGLPLWDLEEGSAKPPASASGSERFERIAAEASASAQVLTVTVKVELLEAAKLAETCAREWPEGHVAARIEDVAFRAIASALDGTGMPTVAGALIIAEDASDVSSALATSGIGSFRELVATRGSGGDASFEDADWVLVSLASLGVASATPRLDGGRNISFAIGSESKAGVATLNMAYDSARWSEGSAARLLTRIRDLIQSPYAMLV
jgi:hypothetical protein